MALFQLLTTLAMAATAVVVLVGLRVALALDWLVKEAWRDVTERRVAALLDQTIAWRVAAQRRRRGVVERMR